ncbi:MAG: tRNA lysidine(34) synthetase TilS [Clostridium butyricum]
MINKDDIESEFSLGRILLSLSFRKCKNIKFADNSFIKYLIMIKLMVILSLEPGNETNDSSRMNGRKKIKDIFIDSKVSVSQRDIVPIIQFDDEAVWLVGLKVSNEYKVTKDTKKLLK